MDIKKLLMGGIIAAILFFLLGWLLYGNLLTNYMATNHGRVWEGVNRDQKDIDFLYLIAGNLALGFLLAYIFVKSNISSAAGGLVTGMLIGLLMGVGFDTMMYATTNIISKKMMAADVATIVVMWTITGAIVGLVMGMGKKEK
jgi:hypothetical protein